ADFAETIDAPFRPRHAGHFMAEGAQRAHERQTDSAGRAGDEYLHDYLRFQRERRGTKLDPSSIMDWISTLCAALRHRSRRTATPDQRTLLTFAGGLFEIEPVPARLGATCLKDFEPA